MKLRPTTDDPVAGPMEPTPFHQQRWNDLQASYASRDASAFRDLGVGDSRTGMMGGEFLAPIYDADRRAVVNVGLAGTLVQEDRYFIQHSTLDYSHIEQVLLNGPGLNNLNHTTDTVQQIAAAVEGLIQDVITKVGHPVHVMLVEMLGQIDTPSGWGYTEDERHQIMHLEKQWCDSTGLAEFVHLSSAFNAYDGNPLFRDDGRHLDDLGYQRLDDYLHGYVQQSALAHDVFGG